MVPYLLSLLESRLNNVENPAMTKAQIVGALKSMCTSQIWGDKVVSILDSNSVWAEYKEQRHDLFITNTHVSGYLTGLLYFFYCCLFIWISLNFFLFIVYI